jgi:hypothetical protein
LKHVQWRNITSKRYALIVLTILIGLGIFLIIQEETNVPY